MLDLQNVVGNVLPKNTNGFRTTHTCELCGFEPKTKNKYREKQDHLVMKHFKEKIDKIFPHCRPYTCPTADCAFAGKDKQALLRHYTGKHGILERYLKEALAEKGIHYSPGEHGSKRRCSTSSEGGNSGKSIKQARLNSPPDMIDPKDLLPKTPVPMTTRPNTEELRKEVEAMMASFQPQSIEPIVLSLPPQAQIVNVQLPTEPVLSNSPDGILSNSRPMPIKFQLPQHPTNVCVVSTSSQMPVTLQPTSFIRSTIPIHTTQLQFQPQQQQHQQQLQQQQQQHQMQLLPQHLLQPQENFQQQHQPLPPFILTTSSTGQLIMTSRPSMTLPSMMSQTTTASPMTYVTSSSMSQPSLISMDMMSNGGMVTSSASGMPVLVSSNPTSTSIMNSDGSIISNDEVMWGAGIGPAVVVEAADTVPITYIETVDGTYVDNIDYDILIPGTNGVDSVRERQLDFCML